MDITSSVKSGIKSCQYQYWTSKDKQRPAIDVQVEVIEQHCGNFWKFLIMNVGNIMENGDIEVVFSKQIFLIYKLGM